MTKKIYFQNKLTAGDGINISETETTTEVTTTIKSTHPITVSTSDPSGTANDGDIWIKYETYKTAIIDKLGVTQSSPVVLDRDWTATDQITIPSGVTNTLDLNGHTITGDNTFRWATVEGTFTLTDSSSGGAGTITTFKASRYGGGGVCVNGTGASFTMSGGSITYCSASRYGGGGVCVNGTGASFTMSGGSIKGCEADSDYSGGGVYIDIGDTFTMSGGNITACKATEGGGVFVRNGGMFTMTSGTISNNTATSNGGGVYWDGATFTKTSGTIENNTPDDCYPTI